MNAGNRRCYVPELLQCKNRTARLLVPSDVMNTILIDKTQDGYVITYIVGLRVKFGHELMGAKSESELAEILKGRSRTRDRDCESSGRFTSESEKRYLHVSTQALNGFEKRRSDGLLVRFVFPRRERPTPVE